MRNALAPIQARVSEAAPTCEGRGYVDAKGRHERLPFTRKAIVCRALLEISHPEEPAQDGHAELTGKVVVAGPCKRQLRRAMTSQPLGMLTYIRGGRQGFQRFGDWWPAKTVKLVPPYGHDVQKPRFSEQLQV